MSYRTATLDVLFGTNGVGKSEILKQLLSLNDRNLVIPANRYDKAWLDYPEIDTLAILKRSTNGEEDDLEWFFERKSEKQIEMQRKFLRELSKELAGFKGTRKLICNHSQIFNLVIHPERGFMNGGLFIDDFKNQIPQNNLTRNVKSLFGDRRHRMLDIFMAAHSPNDMPPKLLDFSPNIYLFRTTANFQRAENKYQEGAMLKLLEAQARINEIAAPQGKTPDDESLYYFEIIKTA